VLDADRGVDGLVDRADGERGDLAPPGCGLKTTAFPAATIETMLPQMVGTECVTGVIAPMTPKGVCSSRVIPWSPESA